MFVHTASQRPSVLAVLTENELVMLDVSKPAEVWSGGVKVLWLVNSKMNDCTEQNIISKCNLTASTFCGQALLIIHDNGAVVQYNSNA